jgi:nitroreductase
MFMSFIDLVKLRKSVRVYDSGAKNIAKDDLDKILDAGRLAPSAKNLQEWKYIVVKKKDLLEKLVPACKGQSFLADADSVIVGCSDKTDYVMTCGQPAYAVDLAISIEHMALMATELGIGSCWIGAFYEDKVKELLDIPENIRVVGLLVLGYPKRPLSEISGPGRKKLEEIVSYDLWRF